MLRQIQRHVETYPQYKNTSADALRPTAPTARLERRISQQPSAPAAVNRADYPRPSTWRLHARGILMVHRPDTACQLDVSQARQRRDRTP
ncbi:MAG: hypothetical protein QW317_04950 [Thermoproteus sp.]